MLKEDMRLVATPAELRSSVVIETTVVHGLGIDTNQPIVDLQAIRPITTTRIYINKRGATEGIENQFSILIGLAGTVNVAFRLIVAITKTHIPNTPTITETAANDISIGRQSPMTTATTTLTTTTTKHLLIRSKAN
jgi:hypothetical protein